MQLLLSLKRTLQNKIFWHMFGTSRLTLLLWMVPCLWGGGTLNGQADQVRINEFMALNSVTLTDGDGQYSDWIELYNGGDEDLSLGGWCLTDSPDVPQRWVFPEVTLGAGAYLVIFASGKDRRVPGGELHTNFKLSGDGEYLALLDAEGEGISMFEPAFPPQAPDISYGFFNGIYTSFTLPTPGAENQQGGVVVPVPRFTVAHGIVEEPFDLEIVCDAPGAVIHYTTDGSTPGPGRGLSYTAPLRIEGTSILRAVAFLDEETVSSTVTATYLFLEDVIRQSNNPEGYPSEWGPYTAIPGTAIADYEMDPELMQDSAFAATVIGGLKSIPTLSLVTDIGYLFSHSTDPDTGGIYIYTGPPLDRVEDGLGKGWERPASIEYFDAEGVESLQINCGVRLQGGHSRRPEKSPKHSFRLVFRSEYGPPKLEYPIFGDEGAATSFKTLILRAGFGLSWIHHSHTERQQAQYQRDIWAKDTQRAMGYPSSRSEYVHLYINGMYWGVYAPSERMDSDFAASYMEGDPEDFDVIKDYQDVIDGEITAWDQMFSMVNGGLETDEAYQRIRGNRPDGTPDPGQDAMVDVVNLADYMLINFYGSNTDWDHHNWAAMRNRNVPRQGFRFFCWDSEHLLKSQYGNMLNINNDLCPSRIFQQLILNQSFRRLFADRVQRYCFDGGLLTPGPAAERWAIRTDQVEPAIPVESARWGDYRRDVHPYQAGGPFDLYGYENYWLPQHDFMVNSYFPERTDIFIGQLRSAGLFPQVDAPLLRVNGLPLTGQPVAKGDLLSLVTGEGVIYYTLDGTDPADWGEVGSEGETVLITQETPKYVLVPRSDQGNGWLSDLAWDQSGWALCSGLPGGIGYERNTGYEAMITLDVTEDMYDEGTDPNTSCYVRIPFTIDAAELQNFANLYLKIRYDDGFAVFLNGIRVAESNAPFTLSWNAAATGTHEAAAAEDLYNISAHVGLLKAGENLLAVQALNSEVTSSDFLVTVELVASENNTSGIAEDAMVYAGPVPLEKSVRVNARTYADGNWSAMTDRFITFSEDLEDLRITEIHYHPLAGDTVPDSEFEFIELKNTGSSTLNLDGVHFVDGISFEFPPETSLGAGAFAVIASNSQQFTERYGFVPSGEYGGNLDNSGEWIMLASPAGDTLISLLYSDTSPWPEMADGTGPSLVPQLFDPDRDQGQPEGWRASYHVGGSPGRDDTESTAVEERLPVTADYRLGQNYPNPFSEVTYIGYTLPEQGYVELSVYNLMGQKVAVLVASQQGAGNHLVTWDGRDDAATLLKEGIYFCRMVVRDRDGEHLFTRKMIKY
jgi:hypothetical protein